MSDSKIENTTITPGDHGRKHMSDARRAALDKDYVGEKYPGFTIVRPVVPYILKPQAYVAICDCGSEHEPSTA
jgi:hypothetical protein